MTAQAINLTGITPEDQAREARITEYFDKMLDATNLDDRRHWSEKLTAEVKQRSPEMVRCLEEKMGLR